MEKIISELEKDIKQYKQVLLYLLDEGEMLKKLAESDSYKRYGASLKIYSVCTSEIEKIENLQVVSNQEAEDILKYYHMYEFSDRFKIIENHVQYGGLLNYVKNGMITEEEFMEAILR